MAELKQPVKLIRKNLLLHKPRLNVREWRSLSSDTEKLALKLKYLLLSPDWCHSYLHLYYIGSQAATLLCRFGFRVEEVWRELHMEIQVVTWHPKGQLKGLSSCFLAGDDVDLRMKEIRLEKVYEQTNKSANELTGTCRLSVVSLPIIPTHF